MALEVVRENYALTGGGLPPEEIDRRVLRAMRAQCDDGGLVELSQIALAGAAGVSRDQLKGRVPKLVAAGVVETVPQGSAPTAPVYLRLLKDVPTPDERERLRQERQGEVPDSWPRIHYRGIPASGPGYARSGNGTLAVPPDVARAWEGYLPTRPQNPAHIYHSELAAFVGGYKAGHRDAEAVEVPPAGWSEERERLYDQIARLQTEEAHTRAVLATVGLDRDDAPTYELVRQALDAATAPAEVSPLAALVEATQRVAAESKKQNDRYASLVFDFRKLEAQAESLTASVAQDREDARKYRAVRQLFTEGQ